MILQGYNRIVKLNMPINECCKKPFDDCADPAENHPILAQHARNTVTIHRALCTLYTQRRISLPVRRAHAPLFDIATFSVSTKTQYRNMF